MRRAHELRHAGGERKFLALDERIRRVLAVVLHELGLVVENVEVRRPAGHVQIHDALHLRGVMRLARQERVHLGRRRGVGFSEERIHRDRAEGKLAGAAEEMAARLGLEEIECGIHAREKCSFKLRIAVSWDLSACRLNKR